jgi:hypothetical protein
MTTSIIPPQDPRYADSGRREAVIAGRPYPCAVRELPDDHPDRKRCSHIVTTRWIAVHPGMPFTANGRGFVTAQFRDPNRDGPKHMHRRYVEILCNSAPSQT